MSTPQELHISKEHPLPNSPQLNEYENRSLLIKTIAIKLEPTESIGFNTNNINSFKVSFYRYLKVNCIERFFTFRKVDEPFHQYRVWRIEDKK